MLKIDNLHATVGDTEILRGLTLEVGAGEIHAIMGPNGAGKSTLAYVLGGRPGYEVTEGSVTFTPPVRGELVEPRDGEAPANGPSTSSGRTDVGGKAEGAENAVGEGSTTFMPVRHPRERGDPERQTPSPEALGSRLRGNDERSVPGNNEGGVDLLALEPHERAAAGLFLGFQYPVEIPGVSNVQFLREALNAQRKARGEEPLSGGEFLKLAREKAALLKLDMEMLKRNVNVGFSGGEKKRAEMVQMGILDPAFAVLDETDSGLDIDALRIVGDGINAIMRKPDKGVLLITHYQRLLEYVKPDVVHVLVKGRIVRSGGPELALELEREGYEAAA